MLKFLLLILIHILLQDIYIIVIQVIISLSYKVLRHFDTKI